MIDKPLYQNPLGGGALLGPQENQLQQDYESQFPNPLEGRIFTQEDGMNFWNSNMPLGMFNVTPPSTPVSEQTPLPGLPEGPPVFATPGLPPPEAPSPDTIVSPLQTVQGPEDTFNPYNRVGQQLMGPNQDDILGTLKNIEQGIASLGQGGMNQSSFGGFNNNFGIGSFFPPYGGMYG